MPLYINDHAVDDLVERYLTASGAKTKSEAVRQALIAGLAALEEQESLSARVAKVQKKAAEAGLVPGTRPNKTYSDDLWGDT